PNQTSSVDVNDRLASDSYDSNGNTIGSAGNTYQYDSENRLVALNAGTANEVRYIYDGDGNRVAKTAGTGASAVTTTYLVDTMNPTGYAQVVEEMTGGSVQRVYVLGAMRVSQQQVISGNWAASFYGYDGHGSVRQLMDSSGAVTDTYTYDGFGNLLARTGSTANDYLYAGEQMDAALGMYYLRARYMNPASGRFWTADSLNGNSFDPLSLHKFLYANGNPVNRRDPSGHESDSLQSLAVAFLVAGTLLAVAQVTYTTSEKVKGRARRPDVNYDPHTDRGPDVLPFPRQREDESNIVYRALRDDENPSTGLWAKDVLAEESLDDHIIHGSDSEYADQYISTTRSTLVAQRYALTGSSTNKRIAVIDFDRVRAPYYDVSTPVGAAKHLKDDEARRIAVADEEVTISRHITPEAIRYVHGIQ
ncbi:MAG TPA: RHS repeat-associated core domain-containing protein, partial [Blastocatellia bacterium]|nr:RHS repeat-associated core domain-containing protein [Blastocatellia bacterium]